MDAYERLIDAMTDVEGTWPRREATVAINQVLNDEARKLREAGHHEAAQLIAREDPEEPPEAEPAHRFKGLQPPPDVELKANGQTFTIPHPANIPLPLLLKLKQTTSVHQAARLLLGDQYDQYAAAGRSDVEVLEALEQHGIKGVR